MEACERRLLSDLQQDARFEKFLVTAGAHLSFSDDQDGGCVERADASVHCARRLPYSHQIPTAPSPMTNTRPHDHRTKISDTTEIHRKSGGLHMACA